MNEILFSTLCVFGFIVLQISITIGYFLLLDYFKRGKVFAINTIYNTYFRAKGMNIINKIDNWRTAKYGNNFIKELTYNMYKVFPLYRKEIDEVVNSLEISFPKKIKTYNPIYSKKGSGICEASGMTESINNFFTIFGLRKKFRIYVSFEQIEDANDYNKFIMDICMHEMLHQLLFLKNSNYDSPHSRNEWYTLSDAKKLNNINYLH